MFAFLSFLFVCSFLNITILFFYSVQFWIYNFLFHSNTNLIPSFLIIWTLKSNIGGMFVFTLIHFIPEEWRLAAAFSYKYVHIGTRAYFFFIMSGKNCVLKYEPFPSIIHSGTISRPGYRYVIPSDSLNLN